MLYTYLGVLVYEGAIPSKLKQMQARVVHQFTHGWVGVSHWHLHRLFIIPALVNVIWVHRPASRVSLCDKHEPVLVANNFAAPFSGL